jgi:hypothetical protein
MGLANFIVVKYKITNLRIQPLSLCMKDDKFGLVCINTHFIRSEPIRHFLEFNITLFNKFRQIVSGLKTGSIIRK